MANVSEMGIQNNKLRIGVSACFFHADPARAIFKGKTLQYAEQSMIRWLQTSGHLVYLIPAPAKDGVLKIADYTADLDGLVLQGGSDVSPLSYGEKPLKPEWTGDQIRDDYELALIKSFQAAHKPILGICRGLQILNVAFGGSLLQDITTQIPQALNHRNWDLYDHNHHEIEILPGTQLSAWYKNMKSAKVNSVHHQGIKDLGKNLLIEAKSTKDGMVEAFRYGGDEWIYGVQWHPEFHAIREVATEKLDESLLDSGPILNQFIKEVRNRK